MNIELEQIKIAAKRIEKIARHTPLDHTNLVSELTGGKIYMKLENTQKTGSFKIRGASNKIVKMTEAGDFSPVIASSAGNHAQGVACAATLSGIKSTIVMPVSAPIAKVQATRDYGAEVVLHGDGYDDAYAKACEICKATGAKFLHPYDDGDVIAGQGTAGLEILADMPDVDIVIVPAGGGGLLSGIACAIKQANPKIKVYGVQAERADAIAKSFAQKKRIITDYSDTIADGIAVKTPGNLTTELINRYVDGVITVSDGDIASAILMLMERSKIVAEPAGAASIAAALSKKIDVAGKKTVCVVSGGNIDVSLIGRLISRGLAVRGRITDIVVILPDKCGAINKVLNLITEAGGNVISVIKNDNAFYIKPNQANYEIRFEAGGTEHKQQIIGMIKETGNKVWTMDDFLA